MSAPDASAWLRGQGADPATATGAAQLGTGANGSAGDQEKPKFIPRELALRLEAEMPVAEGSGQLYVHDRGNYRPGERILRARITEMLGDDWRRNKAEETLGYLRDSSPGLWLDPPRDRINFQNGILDLPTGKLDRHTPEFLSPCQIGAAYDPEAECPEIDKFLTGVIAPELAINVHEVAGYLLAPDNTLQTAVMLLGGGANGKSTLLRVLIEMLGSDNVASVALHRLEEDRFAAAELYGKLANIFADLDARALQASSIFKSITGGDAISGERKYAAPFTFTPYSRLIFSANEAPPTPDSSDAFFRRWLILPFDRRFDGAKADRRLIEKLTTPTELSGLVNKGLAALPGLHARGAFTATDTATEAAERFRVDSDSVAGFLADCTTLTPDGRVPRPRMFDEYRNWCTDNNRRPLSRQRFNHRVQALHPTLAIRPYQGEQCWNGIELGGSL